MQRLVTAAFIVLALMIGGSLPGATSAKKAVARHTAVKTPANRDWTKVGRATAEGNLVLGNPAAPAKLVEYLSFTCPHCSFFAEQSTETLKGTYVRSGRVSLEYRPTVRDPVDLAATILVKCAGPRRFSAVVDQVLALQDDWFPAAAKFLKEQGQTLEGKDNLVALREIADQSGLTKIAQDQGVTSAETDACFKDRKSLNQIATVAQNAGKVIQGTPTFFINGKKAEAGSWSELEPLLKAQGAR